MTYLRIKLYDTVSLNDRVIVFGGRIDNSLQSGSIIAEFNGSWKQIGSLKQPRDGHSVTMQGDDVLVIGGYSNGPTSM